MSMWRTVMKHILVAAPFAICAVLYVIFVGLHHPFDFYMLALFVGLYGLSFLPTKTYNELFGFGLPIKFLLPLAPFMVLAVELMPT